MDIIRKRAAKIVFDASPVKFAIVFNREREDGKNWVMKDGEGNFRDWFCKVHPEKDSITSGSKFNEDMLMTFEEALEVAAWHCDFNDRSDVF